MPRLYPTTRILETYANDPSLTIARMLNEWVDNAFDADAQTVMISRTDNLLGITDDGIGCPNLDLMIGLGQTHEHGGEHSAKFGMGGTVSSIRMSNLGIVKIESTHLGIMRNATIDYHAMLEQNTFDYDPYEERDTNERSGTRITIETPKAIKDPAKIAEGLGFDYATTLQGGKTILFECNGRAFKIDAFKLPKMSERNNFTFEFDGHVINGFTGIVPNWGKQRARIGWWIHWRHRKSINSYAPASLLNQSPNNLYGEIILPSTWQDINLTKDQLSGNDEEFWESIKNANEEIIKRGGSTASSFEIQDFAKSVSALLTGSLCTIKGRREQPDESKKGTKEPSGRGGPHEQFTKSQPAKSLIDGNRQRIRRIIFNFADNIDMPIEVKVEAGTATILFNSAIPAHGNYIGRQTEIVVPVVALALANHLAEHRKQQLLGFEADEKWCDMYETMISSIGEIK